MFNQARSIQANDVDVHAAALTSTAACLVFKRRGYAVPSAPERAAGSGHGVPVFVVVSKASLEGKFMGGRHTFWIAAREGGAEFLAA